MIHEICCFVNSYVEKYQYMRIHFSGSEKRLIYKSSSKLRFSFSKRTTKKNLTKRKTFAIMEIY